MPKENPESRSRLYGFIIFSIIEESIIGVIAFVILFVFIPSLLIPGMIIVIVGLVIFSLIKIYYYQSSSSIPVYDPLVGREGIALTDFKQIRQDCWEGKVAVHSEHWKARATVYIPRNSRVWVESIERLVLNVSTTPSLEKTT